MTIPNAWLVMYELPNGDKNLQLLSFTRINFGKDLILRITEFDTNLVFSYSGRI